MKPRIQDPIRYAREVVGGDPFAAYLGVVVEEVTEGFARLSLLVRPEYLNGLGRVHGGVVAMMLDQAFAVAANSRGISSVSLTVTMSYHGGASCGSTLVSEARPLDVRRKVSTWEIVCRSRDDDTLVASARGTAYHQG